ncbi:dephospho-CoA kinase [Desertifilum sp. FACHB-1129]|uniref:Dephospho-CoA kinase n=2 Tax=Desertifilum tharense IPPAS B-1220 TaxID=1781255 RepID=A0A1E5QJX0_9CYAN|nr:dephospho-CoA kinase [Desertifilum sp. FACHB-1129]MBD2320999.1 dephospho-CoA kinase [Desertifilum sp. FACHB-866]MBD2331128.1 dephospho-CoA kinase [Desertifilum sp. FACHB-868]OEJ74643.1 dephospho-CoA kinase [Desertifilum tharense IPPAS B-1220]
MSKIVNQSRRIIGLTGGIATGKTTVANYLAQIHQLPVFDADIYAREAVTPDSPVLERLVQRYSQDILETEGSLNRAKLANIIFHDSNERQWVEQQIHPEVRSRFIQNIENAPKNAGLVLVIPLLFEAQMTDLVTEIWVVYCNFQQQLERLMQRNTLSLTEAKARIDAQMSIEQKCQQAQVILDNSTTIEALFQQIDSALVG